jgi:hypothetical protein
MILKGIHPQTVFAANAIIVEDRACLDFGLMKQRINADNIFIISLKDNTVYESIKEKDLPKDEDQHILKDEILKLASKKAIEIGINEIELR